jgi:hypothetical protein
MASPLLNAPSNLARLKSFLFTWLIYFYVIILENMDAVQLSTLADCSLKQNIPTQCHPEIVIRKVPTYFQATVLYCNVQFSTQKSQDYKKKDTVQ